MGFLPYDRSQTNLLGYSVEDFARNDSKSRFVVDLVSRLDLTQLFSRYSPQGGDSYAPDMMLALWFFAYSNGITSTRELEELCKFDTRYIYISCNQHPDHTTLSRFRKAHLDLLSDYFIQIILLAQQEGISDFKNIAIDGTKIRSKSSGRHTLNEKQLNKKIRAIRRDISHYMQRCDFAEQNGEDAFTLETLRAEKERLEALEKKLLARKKQLKKRKKTLKPEHRSKHSINILEPDARLMPNISGPSYNSQVGVDMDTHLIVAADVVTEPNDQGQFIPIQKQVETNLFPDSSRRYTADSGYHNAADLEALEKEEVDAVIADPKPLNRTIQDKPTSLTEIQKANRKVERRDFHYNEEDNFYECPFGDKLLPVKNKGHKVIYRASQCYQCPLKSLCVSSKKKVKQIHRSRREKASENMSRKLETPEAKARLKQRSTTVEPVFGNLKENLGFRRFNLLGLENTRAEFILMSIAHNINILFKLMQTKRFAALYNASISRWNQYIAMSKTVWVIFMTQFFKKQNKSIYAVLSP